MNVLKKDMFGNQGAKGKLRRDNIKPFHASALDFLKITHADHKSSSQASSLSQVTSSVVGSSQSSDLEQPLSLTEGSYSFAPGESTTWSKHSNKGSIAGSQSSFLDNEGKQDPNKFGELMKPFLLFENLETQRRPAPSPREQSDRQLKVSFEDEHFSPIFKKPKLLFNDESGIRASTSRSKPESDIFRVLANSSNVSHNFTVDDLRVPDDDGPASSQAEVTFPPTTNRKSSSSAHPNTTSSTSGKDIAEKAAALKGNSTTLGTTDSELSSCIIAVTEGRGYARGEVGVAAMDPRRPHLILCQISDTQCYTHSLAKMNVFNFVEAIVPNTFVEGGAPRKLFLDMLERFPSVSINHVQRRHFSEQIGLHLIRQYCSKDSESVMIVLRDKFYALSAAAALLKYIEYTQNVIVAPRSLKVEYQGIEGTMIIDLDTASRLELVMGLASRDPAHSLFGALKHCRTKGGLRLLRANILQPPADADKINSRLTCVKELIDNPILFNAVESVIGQMTNVENLLSLCMRPPQQEGLKVADSQMKYTLLLKSTLELIPSLSTALADATSDYFVLVRENLQDTRFKTILDRVLLTVSDVSYTKNVNQVQWFFMIKTEINGLLDVARKTYSELAGEISSLVTNLATKHGLPLRLGVSQSRGFHIQISAEVLKEKELPSEFILVNHGRSLVTCVTLELVALDQRCTQSLNEIKLMANVLLFELLSDIRDGISCLFPLCEYIAELDVCITFAHIGASQEYIPPKFEQELRIEQARHPMLDATARGRTVANDVFADTENNFIILTGPNQSGKSIYIRQIALLQIMAQISCYVPAKSATFRIADRIFSRIGFDDSIESNASSLMVEMRDMDFIRRNLTPTSLVIVDELCRGTSIDEGSSLAFTIAEELLDSKAFVFFTTHLMILTKLQQMYYNVRNFHFEALLSAEDRPTLRFTHRMLPGVTPADQYGIRLAELMGFPPSILTKARQCSQILKAETKPMPSCSDLTSRYEIAKKLRMRLAAFGPSSWKDMVPFVEDAYRDYSLLPPADEYLSKLLQDAMPPSKAVTSDESVTSDAQSNAMNASPVSKNVQQMKIGNPVVNAKDIDSPSVQLAAEMLLHLHRSAPQFAQSNISSPEVKANKSTLDTLNQTMTQKKRQKSDRNDEAESSPSLRSLNVSKNEQKKKDNPVKNVSCYTKKMENLRSVLSEVSSKLPSVKDPSAYYEWKYSKKKSMKTVAVASRERSAMNSPSVATSYVGSQPLVDKSTGGDRGGSTMNSPSYAAHSFGSQSQVSATAVNSAAKIDAAKMSESNSQFKKSLDAAEFDASNETINNNE